MSAFIFSQKTLGLGYDTLEYFTATSTICMNHEPGPNAKYSLQLASYPVHFRAFCNSFYHISSTLEPRSNQELNVGANDTHF